MIWVSAIPCLAGGPRDSRRGVRGVVGGGVEGAADVVVRVLEVVQLVGRQERVLLRTWSLKEIRNVGQQNLIDGRQHLSVYSAHAKCWVVGAD